MRTRVHKLRFSRSIAPPDLPITEWRPEHWVDIEREVRLPVLTCRRCGGELDGDATMLQTMHGAAVPDDLKGDCGCIVEDGE